MNKKGDVAALVNVLQYLTKKYAEQKIELPEANLAAMRDIGIVLGSLKRHGVEPIAAVPEVEQQLLDLGYATDMIPRDTVHHYTTWNPLGLRRRKYTFDEQEGWLQDAVAFVFPSLSASLEISEALSKMETRDVRFGPTVDMLTHASRVMVEAIESVTAKVSPIFFAQTLRPYFEEITVGGRTYLGPAAAQSPLWLIHLCVWASDRNQPDYQSFLLESIEYSLPPWRAFYLRHTLKPSMVSRITEDYKTIDSQLMEGLIRSTTSLTELLTTLRQFRARHIGMAHRAYSEEVRLYDHGSGGAPVALLKQILDLTRENEKLMRNASDFNRHRDNQLKTNANSLVSSL
ncbi:MAG: DUF1864 family protein [Gammaproteobacteria bacterium]|nr:DUF1864 family protein [Gammaproteobacteria bacterium]